MSTDMKTPIMLVADRSQTTLTQLTDQVQATLVPLGHQIYANPLHADIVWFH
jgi:hypothetical protein